MACPFGRGRHSPFDFYFENSTRRRTRRSAMLRASGEIAGGQTTLQDLFPFVGRGFLEWWCPSDRLNRCATHACTALSCPVTDWAPHGGSPPFGGLVSYPGSLSPGPPCCLAMFGWLSATDAARSTRCAPNFVTEPKLCDIAARMGQTVQHTSRLVVRRRTSAYGRCGMVWAFFGPF